MSSDGERHASIAARLRQVEARRRSGRTPRPASQAQPPRRPLRRRWRGGTVLVVEDEPLTRELIQRVLTRAGLSVLVASDGRRALERIAEHDGDLDLIVSDVDMPSMGGIELAHAVHRQGVCPRMLLVSGLRAPPSQVLPSLELGFLPKPFTADQLVEAVARLHAPDADGTQPELTDP